MYSVGSADEVCRVLRTSFGIDEREQEILLGALSPMRLSKGQRLPVRTPGHAVLGIVTSGCLRVFFTEADGSDRIVSFAPEGWCVADVGGLAPAASAPLVIEALETTEVWLRDTWIRPAASVGAEVERIYQSLTESTLRALHRRLVGSMRKTAAQRYQEFQSLYPGLDNRISQYHVAAYVGVSPEFLCRLRKRLLRRAS